MATAEASRSDPPARSDRALDAREKRTLAALALPTFGLAFAVTVVSSYLPSVADAFVGSTMVIGLLIGAEGVAALTIPLAVGSWSDGLDTRLGRRLPFIVAGVPIAMAGLAVMAVAGSLGVAAVAVAVFYAGYFVAYEPYRALYPDLVPDEVAGRAQSSQAISRGAATVCALAGGGALLALGQAVPFAVAAVALVATCAVFVALAVRRRARQRPEDEEGGDLGAGSLRELLDLLGQERALRAFFFANALWELALAALKTFVILWLTKGLGLTLSGAGGVVGAVAVFVLAGAATSGKLADRFGRRRVMLVAVSVFAATLVVPLVSASPVVIAAASPFIAFSGGVLLSLPYALLVPLMPEGRHGLLTGFYSTSRGVGVMLGPVLGGLAVSAGSSLLSQTDGYAAVWFVCSAASVLSVPFLLRVREPGER